MNLSLRSLFILPVLGLFTFGVCAQGLSDASSFPIGVAVNVPLLKSVPAYRAVVDKEFNSITPEVAIKFLALHPSAGTYNWDDADYLINYAKTNHKRIHGHTLIWYRAVPDWVTKFKGDSAAWENLVKTHIQTVVAHFKGKVSSWDVVNEAFNDDGTMRNSIWYQHLGRDYIARCFRYAREADPDVLLFYNDYGQEYSPAKRQAIINMVNDFKKRGIPLNGLGMQMHTSSKAKAENIVNSIREMAQTGLKIHISELDISLNPENKADMVLTPEMAALQMECYKTIVQTVKALPAAQVYGITIWNVGDSDSWVRKTYKRPDWPLPFDDNYQKKPAYQGILDGLK